MLSSVEQAFVGMDDIRASLKTPAWEAKANRATVKPVYNGNPWEMTRLPLYAGQLCKKYKATEKFGKLSGDRNIQGRYIQV